MTFLSIGRLFTKYVEIEESASRVRLKNFFFAKESLNLAGMVAAWVPKSGLSYN